MLHGADRPGRVLTFEQMFDSLPGAVTEQMFDAGSNGALDRVPSQRSLRVFNLIPATTSVSVDAASGRPREIRTEGRRLRVTALESVRDETSAHPLQTGPRTVFVVRADAHRYRLIHRLDDRSWTIEDLGGWRTALAQVA